ECCECGCCSYICPAGRPLTQVMKQARKDTLALKRQKGGK
ncbi:MAG: electron transporter RnfC, partial [Lachnospiraceae bacterium]|nr:electron transporter RnfC [Lachnospiraceae bacterium]